MMYILKIRGDGPSGNNGFEGDVESILEFTVENLESYGHMIHYAAVHFDDDKAIVIKKQEPERG